MEESGPTILKCDAVHGSTLQFRNVSVSDAEFIVGLRTHAEKARYISSTSDNLEHQVQWLKSYEASHAQAYFIIERRDGKPVGTVRLYDPRGFSFSWGSWIMMDGALPPWAMESALMIYHYALRLGFLESHFEVRKANATVWRFHELFGAVRVGETNVDYHFTLSHANILESLSRFAKYLPNGIS